MSKLTREERMRENRELFRLYKKSFKDAVRWCEKTQRVKLLKDLDSDECFDCEKSILNNGVCDPL